MLLPSQHEGLLVASNVQGVTALYSEFEGNSGGWSLGQDKPCESMASVQRIGPDGSAALRVTGLGSGMRLDYSANFTLKKGSTYTITYWVKTSAPASVMVAMEPGWVFDARVITDVSGADLTDGVYLYGSSQGGSWQKITNTFTVSDIKNKTSGTPLSETPVTLSIRYNEPMAAKGIVAGVTSTTFEPEREVTRAEFATLMVKTLNITSDAPANFADVGQHDWFYPYVKTAANAGLIVGYDGYFRPDDRITREEMAVIVAKAYAYAGQEAASGGIDKFTDKEMIAQWAYAAVDTVTSAGLIAGMTPDTFEASANTTRAQAVAVLRRFMDAIQ